MKIGIVGAGLSGIVAAKELVDRGHSVELIEKSRSVGGRLATRRIGDGKADHGAVYFTVRSERLQLEVDSWLEQGWIRQWYADPYPRYVAVNGMNALAKRLAEGLTVHLNERVESIKVEKTVIVKTDTSSYQYDAVIVTSPLPQTFELLDGISLSDKDKQLQELGYDPTFVGLFELERETAIGQDGILDQDLAGGLLKVVNNRQKGISSTELISVYMEEAWSLEWYEREAELILTEIEQLVKPILTGASVRSKQLKRWRYAQAKSVWNEPFHKLDQHPVFLAGDIFLEENDPSGRTRFESAYLSGLRVAEAILHE